jgi:acetyl-CoA C-acetyltransferase
MDQFALRSHERAVEAQEKGWFNAEIVPVQIAGRKGAVTEVTQDEGPRKDTTLETLSKLKPAFKADGKVSPGNSSQMSDGAAAVVISSRAYVEKHGLKPMARIVGYAQAAVEPKYLFAAPAYAMPKLLKKIGWTFADVDLIELNEAFAAQVLADGYALSDQGWDWDKVNVNGGAIAIGHPLGASGTRVLVTLLHALKNRGLKRGIASLCLGGGEAVAMAVEIE